MILDYKSTHVFFTDQGQGQPIVMLHGFLEHSFIWNDMMPKLSQNNRMICIDLLGHGKTGCISETHTMEDMALAVHYVLKHIGIQRAIFLGHSMGGYVTLALAELFPDYILGLGLVNSSPLEDSLEKKQNRLRAIEAVRYNKNVFIGMAVTNLFAKKNLENFIYEIQKIKDEAMQIPLEGIIAALRGMRARPDRTTILKHGDFEKWIVIGLKDSIIDQNLLEIALKDIEINITEFPDGHMSFIENKTELENAIMHFVEKI